MFLVDFNKTNYSSMKVLENANMCNIHYLN